MLGALCRARATDAGDTPGVIVDVVPCRATCASAETTLAQVVTTARSYTADDLVLRTYGGFRRVTTRDWRSEIPGEPSAPAEEARQSENNGCQARWQSPTP